MLNGIANGYAVSVSDLPIAWKIERVYDEKYRGFEYVRYGPASSAVACITNPVIQASPGGRPRWYGI